MNGLSFGADPILKLIKASETRKRLAAQRLRYYEDDQSQDTLALIARRWSSPEDFRVFQVNMVRKIVNKRAMVYRAAPVRRFEGMDQAAGDALYAAMNANAVLKRANRLTKLLKTAMLQVGWRDGRPTLAVVTGNILDVVYEMPEGPSRIIVTQPGAIEADTIYSDWTAGTFTKRDYRGHPIRLAGNAGRVNPYGMLPFVPLFDRVPDDGFWLPGGNDLIEAQQAVNVALSNLWRAVELQAHGQAWASGVPIGDAIKVGPDRAITLPENGKFGFAAPNAPIEEILRAIQFVMRQTAAANDLSADVFDLDRSAESGAAKRAEREDLAEARQDDIELWRTYESRLFDVVKRVANTHRPGTVLEEAAVHLDFAEVKETLSDAERLENARRYVELGMWSPVDAFMSMNPDFGTRDEVITALRVRKGENDQILGIGG